MRRIPLAVALAAATLAAAAPAAAAKGPSNQVRTYKLTAGEGTIRVAFRGDEQAGCAARGTCSLSGTTSYAFSGRPGFGEVHWLRARKRTLVFSGFLETLGETASDVASAGSAERCVDRISRRRVETLQFEPRSRRVRFEWRKFNAAGEPEQGIFFGNGESDPLDTRCAGPAIEDIAAGMPFSDVPYHVFRSPRASFRTTGTRPFSGGGFAGTVEWDLGYSLQYRVRRSRR